MFIDEYVANCTQQSDFDLKNFAKQKTAIYVLLPDDRETYHKLRKLISTANLYITCRNEPTRRWRAKNKNELYT